MTNHAVVGAYKTFWSEDEAGVSGGGTHEFLKCDGCETPTLRSETWFSEEPGETAFTFHPPRKSGDPDRKPRQFQNIPWGSPLDSAYRQTVAAFNQQLFTLAGAGVRLVIEGVCKERGVSDGHVTSKCGKTRRNSLEGKINGLAEKNFISTQQAETLHQIRFLGNDAAHELDQPSSENVNLALDIVEHLLEQVYEQPEKARAIASRKRPKK
jgi:hypothetical protein